MSEVIMWSDFERFNETYFWSKQRNIFIEPEIEESTGLSFRSVVLADGNGTLMNRDSDTFAYCICKHLGKNRLKMDSFFSFLDVFKMIFIAMAGITILIVFLIILFLLNSPNKTSRWVDCWYCRYCIRSIWKKQFFKSCLLPLNKFEIFSLKNV